MEGLTGDDEDLEQRYGAEALDHSDDDAAEGELEEGYSDEDRIADDPEDGYSGKGAAQELEEGDDLEDLDEDLDEDTAEYTDAEVYGEGTAEGLEYDSDEAGAEAAEGMRHRRGFARGEEPAGELDGGAVGEALPGGSQRRR